MKFNLSKLFLLDTKAHWCGRDITGDGITFNARNAEKFKTMATPILAGDLGQFLMCLNWMRGCLPRFQEESQELWDLFTKARNKGGTNKKRSYEKINLKSIGWNESHQAAYDRIKDLLDQAIEMAHFDPNDPRVTLCLLTDASQRHYAALLTQVRDWDVTKPVYEQAHEPLRTFSGEFRGSMVKWSTIEKESYPIIEAVKEWQHYLLCPNGFRVYCDHENLVSLFKPESINPALSKSAMDKVYRWLYTLGNYKLISMEHLPGQHNVWADMLSRWAHPTYYDNVRGNVAVWSARKRNKLAEQKLRERGRELNEFLNLQFDPRATDYRLPNLAIIKEAQQEENLNDIEKLFLADPDNVADITRDADNLILYKGKLWIPSSNRELILRIMIVSHCGDAGHRDEAKTWTHIQDLMFWEEAKADIHEFCQHCLCCAKTKTGATVPRPFGEQVKGQFPGDVVHFDYMYIGKPPNKYNHDYQYVLVLKDDFSGLVELIPAKTCDHVTVVNALEYWQGRYGTIHTLVSDQGSHFKNLVMDEYVKMHHDMSHHFTIAYSPWANGTVERVNRDLKQLLDIMIMESKGRLGKHDWPYILPHVMGVINSTRSDRNAGYSPRTVFMGLLQYNPLHVIYNPNMKHGLFDLNADTPKIKAYVDALLISLSEMHKAVSAARIKAGKRNRRQFEDGKGGTRYAVDFDVGDFVLMAVPHKLRHKLEAVWRGPYRVTRVVNSHLYELEHLVSGVLVISHIQRIKFFADSDMDVTIPLCDTITSQDAHSVYEPEELLKWQYNRITNSYEVLVKWVGFSDMENTWQDLELLYEDVPKEVVRYIATLPADVATAMRVELHLE